jgi:Mg-chelatase subunit ChlD
MLRPLPALSAAILCHAAGLAAQGGTSSFGHARARDLAELGKLPSAPEIVVRDLVNYHRHRLPLPNAGVDVALDLRCDRAAAAAGDEVWVQVGYTTAPQGNRAFAPPCAVCLVIDVSGSMQEAGKLTAVQQGLRAFVDRLRPDDEVALVTFSTEANVAERLQRRGDGRWLVAAFARLTAEGNTNLHAGMMLGLDQLGRATTRTPQRRLIVLTDGIANRGTTEPEQILADAQRRAETTVDISTVGVGQNLDVRLLQQLADGCRGLFHFVADGQDVAKVFGREADALLATVAREPQLVLRLPEALVAEQVFDERARIGGNEVEVLLPDLNAGVTGVVMVRCRVAHRHQSPAELHATIRFDGASVDHGGRHDTVHADAKLVIDPRSEGREDDRSPFAANGAIDFEVRKNAAIAVLAQGLADMAVQCDARRWADANRALQRASDDAERLLPRDGSDDDVRAVQTIVAGHERTLRRYVDRFRDL